MKNQNRIVSAILAMIMLLSSVVFTFTSCGDKGKDNTKGPGSGSQDNGKTVDYSVTIITKGGMPLANIPVYFHEYNNGSVGEMVKYAATDMNGKVTVKLSENGRFAANIAIGLPDGYDAQSIYPLVSNNLKIELSSAIIPNTNLTGVSYQLGSVMRDFTVDTTVLVKNDSDKLVFEEQTFTLSEALKEKDAVLINFWYTDCSWCVTEFPLMQKAYEKFSDDIAVIALDPYTNDTPTMIQSFQSQMKLTFNMAPDTVGLANAFGVPAYPTSVMIDRYGVVTMIEVGAITSQRAFDVVFDHFTGDNYEQKLIAKYSDIVPKEKPNVQMPASEQISNAFDKGTIGDITYLPYPDSASDEEKEYSWPFVNDTAELNGKTYDVIKNTNAFKEGSFAQIIFNVNLKPGDVLAFDYFSSTELSNDIMYVVVDGKDIYSISGESTDWKTCFAYVAEEEATYEVAFIYMKDSTEDVGQDTIYLKDLRIVKEKDVNSPTYIYRYAATNPDDFNEYQDYVDLVVGSDGYYHVGTANGPILLANLMGYTRFSDDNTVYYMAVELYEGGYITKDEYNKLIEYCNYASNSAIYGVTSVTPELKTILDKIVFYFGDQSNENDWLRLCCYYDAYGTNGKQLADPIKGLSTFSAYTVIESAKGSTAFPNSFTYDRVIMPRGLLGKFTPKTSGVYLITSNAGNAECNGWIFTKGSLGERVAWLTYENVDRMNDKDYNNCYMMAYLEAGKDYYIDIAFYDVYGEGTIKYRVERLGGEGYYRFSLAAPGYFTAYESLDGELAEMLRGGIDIELGEDGIWREKRTDGREGSILYADFTKTTPIFTSNSLGEMIDRGAFNFTVTETGEPSDLGPDLTELARKIYANRIVVGNNPQLGGEYVDANDERVGCVIVTEEVAELLQLLMDKYTFEGVENSWTKLCYYHQYFCEATPI